MFACAHLYTRLLCRWTEIISCGVFLQEGESIFGSGIKNHEQEFLASRALYELVQAQVAASKVPSFFLFVCVCV